MLLAWVRGCKIYWLTGYLYWLHKTASIQKLSEAKVFNIFLMVEIFLVSSWDTSHSHFGIQNQNFGIPWISGYCKFQTLKV
jgi:hypothetical protein